MDNLVPNGLAAEVPRPVEDDVEGWRVTREEGMGGGPMEVRTPAAPGRVLVVAETARALEGVLVRDTAVLEAAEPTCLVGDFVGDLRQAGQHDGNGVWGRQAGNQHTRVMLLGRVARGAGLGLAALRLIRLLKPGSAALDRRPVPGAKLLGREVFLTAGFAAAAGGGAAAAAGG